MVNLPNTTPIALMNYFGAKSSQAISKLQTTFRPRQPAKAHRLKVLKNAENQPFHLLKPAETQLKLLYLADCTRKKLV